MSKIGRIGTLDSVRGIAVVVVVIRHERLGTRLTFELQCIAYHAYFFAVGSLPAPHRGQAQLFLTRAGSCWSLALMVCGLLVFYLVHLPVVLTLTILTRGTLSLPLLIAIPVPVSIALAVIFERLKTAPSATLGHCLAHAKRDLAHAPRPVLKEGRV